MRAGTLALLRCPYCGGHVRLRDELPHQADGDDIASGVLVCNCAQFPLVGGIAVMTLEGMSDPARELVAAGEHARALRAMFGGGDEEMDERYDAMAADPALTYRRAVDALGPEFAEARYFVYRFSDPTFLVADAVVRAIAAVVLREREPAIDICGGSGHLTRTLLAFTPTAVLLDWSFPKLWLARRFTAPACQPVCADAQIALPFAASAFRLAVCSDAFHYVWAKALLAHEMTRLVGFGGAVVVTHTHNRLQPNPSPGTPLPPDAYEELFEEAGGRLFPETRLLEGVLRHELDLAHHVDRDTLDRDHALTIVASRRPDVFARYPVRPAPPTGELRVNPLYAVTRRGNAAHLDLSFPSPEYEQEYARARDYLPSEASLDARDLAALARGDRASLDLFLRQRVVLDLPPGWD